MSSNGMTRIDRAIVVATVAHGHQKRHGTEIPYIVHPYSVGLMLQAQGCDEDLVIAGILHDTVEDTELEIDDIAEQFGENVARLVAGCTEHDKTSSWEERKRHTLHFLETAEDDVRLVACADKLHNVRSIAADRAALGEDVWKRFKRGRDKQAWYYRGLVEALCREPLPDRGSELFLQLRRHVLELFG